MMKLKVAILEDNKELLKHYHSILVNSGLVEVVAHAKNSDEFFENIKGKTPEALLLDIDLGGDSMSGMDIAYKLKLPVLFVSGHNAENLKEIEDLKWEYGLTIDHISKPFSDEKFIKTVSRFINDVATAVKSEFIPLDFGDTRGNKIPVDSIVCLCSDKDKGAVSNNKEIYFTDRKPEILIDFSFTKMEDKGFSKNKFITIHKSFRVNVDRIVNYHKNSHEIEVLVTNSTNKTERKLLPVSENYRNDVSRFKK